MDTSPEGMACRHCNKLFKTPSSLATHEKTHLSKNFYRCVICQLQMPKKEYTEHIQQVCPCFALEQVRYLLFLTFLIKPLTSVFMIHIIVRAPTYVCLVRVIVGLQYD